MRLPLVLAAIALLSASVVAHADTIDFTYSGTLTASTATTGTVEGIGSFSFAGLPSVLSLSDLTAFSYTETFDTVAFGSFGFSYSLADLTSFSATMSGGTLLTLSLNTDAVPASIRGILEEEFIVNSLATGGAETFTSTDTSDGTVSQTIAPTPEPSSLTLLGTGLLGFAGIVRRRFVA